MEKYVKVPINEYIRLRDYANTLLELVGAGVDNWPGYEECDFKKFTEKDITLPIIEE
jgi:hypothetical protein